MPWSAGTFTRVDGSNTFVNDRDAAIKINAPDHDTHDQDLADGINACLKKDGGNAASADISMGSNKLTNVTDPTADQDAATKKYVDDTIAAKLVTQTVNSVATFSTGTTVMPSDDTIPQIGEGTEFLTISVTPANTANRLEISGILLLSATTAADMTVALFQDATANALAAWGQWFVANTMQGVAFHYEMAAGTTSATTFRLRAGIDIAGTVGINGYSGGRIYGGVAQSFVLVKEFVT